MPSEERDPHLYQLVKTFQIHCHSKTCHKYKNSKCHFKFGHFSTDKTINAIEEGNPHLYQLVKTFQIHCHSNTCHKYKNSKCRFKFGHFSTDKTINAILLQHTLNQVDKFGILSKRNNILGQVKKYIDNNLDPNSKSFSNDLSIQEILSSMGIIEDDYYWALSISPGIEHEIHLKRSKGSCFVNNYNLVLLKAWEANLDIQPVHNYFKVLTYMTAYF